ncbi:helix-turn-helix domain-containing protein [Serratia marcescens]|uniref:helix-turn-helix domain-containing protein n=1 Tax=Serratia marcescens TaxID=615 RepID=UPI0012497B2D|nr:helix-turn-helix domain-containing protein [Serratia marcescens]
MNNKKEGTELDLLTPEEVCKLIGGVTTKTLRDWNNNHRHRQILAPIRFTHKVVRYERKNVLAFIAKCRSSY